MEHNHIHNVIAFFVFFAVCALFAYITKPKKKYMYGNAKAGDCLKPKG
jgi:hypothetical protein